MSNYSAAVLTKGPIAYWRLGESPASGTIARDETGNGHHGTFHGPLVLGEPGALNGDDNTAVLFARSGYIEVPSHPNLSQPTSSVGLSVEAWIRPDTIDFAVDDLNFPYVHWIAKGDPNDREWALRMYASRTGVIDRPNRISAYIYNSIGGEGAGAYFQKGLGAGEWLHVVACYQPGDKLKCPPAGVQIFRNGRLEQGPMEIGTLYCNSCFSITPTAGTSPLRIGRRNVHDYFPGAIDEVAIYPRVLTATEVLDNYHASGRS